MRKFYLPLLLLVCSLSVLNSFSQTTLLKEGFESATFPPTGWRINNNAAGATWTRNTTANLSLSGTSSLRCTRNLNNPNDAWIFTPKLTLNTNVCNITFWARVRTATDTGRLRFTVGNDTTIASQTTILADSSNINSPTYALWSISYTPSSAGDYNFAFNCYSAARSAIGQGIYIDSLVITQLQNTCSGTPIAGTTLSTSNAVCSSSPYTLSVIGSTNGVTGISYQWQSSLDGINWSNSTNDTTTSITKTGLVTSTYYRRKIVCAASGLFDYSSVIKISANAIINCYCGPNTGVNLNTGVTGASIDTVRITGTKLNNITTGIATGGYTLNNDSLLVPTATMQQTLTYNLFVGLTTQATPFPLNGIASVWVDWNHNGTFDSTEYSRVVTNGQSGTIALTVPANAVLGATMMRVRAVNNAGAVLTAKLACTSYNNGETEDYLIYVIAPIVCTGTPVAGTTSTTSNLVCPASFYTLSVTGASAGVAGLSYQWQTSLDSTNWIDIVGDTTESITKTGLTASTYYKRKIKCANSGLSAFSSVIKVSVNSIINCYCGPNTGVNLNSGTTGASIDTVKILGTNLNNISTGIAVGGYTLNSDSTVVPTATLQQSLQYNLFIGLTTVTTPFPVNGIASVWVDWNHSGTFDSSEYSRVVTNGQSGTISLTVPANAVLGATMMRVRSKNNTGGGLAIANACTSYTNGETEDYVIYVTAPIACSGTPAGGVTASNNNPVCPSTQFILSVTGATGGVGGLTYQWQSSSDNINWTDRVGVTTLTDTIKSGITSLTYYRRKITCNGVASSYSIVDTVKVNTPANCYCSPNNGTTLNTGTTGASIDTVNIIGTTWVGNITNGIAPYILYNDSSVLSFPKLQQAQTYSIFVGLTLAPGNGIASAWFDWNQNGKFDSSEYVRVITNGQRGTVNFTVPINATLGNTIMRIRSKNNVGAGLAVANACTSYANGETEDYTINILAGNTCSGTPNPGTAYASVKTICPNTSFNLFDTASSTGVTGLSYQWQSSSDSINWTNIVAATNGNYAGATITAKTYFRRLTTCGANTANSNNVLVNIYPSSICMYCSPLSGTTLHTTATAPSVDSVSIVGTSLINASPGQNTIAYYLDTTKPVPSLYQTFNYTLRVKLSVAGLAGAWIDWNHNGTFDTTEYVPVTITGSAGTATFTVPVGASIGRTILRVRSRAAGGGGVTINKTMACTTFPQGETEDYIVEILPVPPCLPASNATVSNITASGATIRWVASTSNPSSGYNVYINNVNNFGTATLAANAINADSLKINGLAGSTLYYVWIESNCGSSLSPTIITSFTTNCGIVTNLPLIQDFESITTVGVGVVPACWTATTSAAGGRTNFTSSQTTSRNGIGAKSGTKFIYARRNNYDWLISPGVQLTAGTPYYFVYYYRPTDPNTGITINSFAAMANDTTTLATGSIGTSIVNPIDSSKYTQSVNSFTPTTSGVYYFAIQCINLAGAGAANNNLNIDDVIITNTLITQPPSITSFNPKRATLGNTVTIKGSNFNGTTNVKFGNTNATSFAVANDSTITAVVGNGSTGYVKVNTVIGSDSLIGFIYCPTATTNIINLSGCNSVIYNNVTYINNTTKRDTIRTLQGCDSIYKVANIFISPLTTVNQVNNLNGCNSVSYKGNVYAVSTTIKDTLKSVGNCDSIYNTINITINHNFSGNIKHPTKGNIIGVTTKMTGTTNNTLVANGNYSFDCLPSSTVATIKPTKNNDVKKNNGVSSIDVILVQNHILNKIKLNSPYKIIAADVNNNKSISNIDIIFMKRLILGIDTTFTSNKLWAFVDSSYAFPDTTNPFPYKDSINIANFASNKTNQTFIGVKLGDVNYDWNPALAKGTKVDNVELVFENYKSQNNNYELRVPITVKNFKDLTALQYTLHFNQKDYAFVGIENNKLGLEFNKKQAIETGDISFLWADARGEEKSLEDGSILFELVLKTNELRTNKLDLGLALTNDITEIEAWDKNNQQHNIILSKKETPTSNVSLSSSEKWSVAPNPTSGEVIVNMLSKENRVVVFELTNSQGKLCMKQSFEAKKGNNSISINLKKNKHLPNDVYFLKAIGLENNETKRVVVIGE